MIMDPSMSQQAYTSMMKFTMDGRPYIKVKRNKQTSKNIYLHEINA